jgi:ribosomal protein L29
MKTREEIKQRIRKLQDEIYRLRQQEDYEWVNNQTEINLCQAEIGMLEWVLN